MTDKEDLKQLREPTEADPLRVLMSACLVGVLCGVDGSSNGSYPPIVELAQRPNVKVTSFCPEDFAL